MFAYATEFSWGGGCCPPYLPATAEVFVPNLQKSAFSLYKSALGLLLSQRFNVPGRAADSFMSALHLNPASR